MGARSDGQAYRLPFAAVRRILLYTLHIQRAVSQTCRRWSHPPSSCRSSLRDSLPDGGLDVCLNFSPYSLSSGLQGGSCSTAGQAFGFRTAFPSFRSFHALWLGYERLGLTRRIVSATLTLAAVVPAILAAVLAAVLPAVLAVSAISLASSFAAVIATIAIKASITRSVASSISSVPFDPLFPRISVPIARSPVPELFVPLRTRLSFVTSLDTVQVAAWCGPAWGTDRIAVCKLFDQEHGRGGRLPRALKVLLQIMVVFCFLLLRASCEDISDVRLSNVIESELLREMLHALVAVHCYEYAILDLFHLHDKHTAPDVKAAFSEQRRWELQHEYLFHRVVPFVYISLRLRTVQLCSRASGQPCGPRMNFFENARHVAEIALSP